MKRLALLLWLAAGAVSAHTGGTTGFASIQVSGQSIRYALTLGFDALVPAGIDPATADVARLVADHVQIAADGAPCAALPQPATPPPPDRISLFVVVLYACAGPVRELTLRDDLFDRLGANHHTLVQVEWPGGQQSARLEPAQRTVTLPIPQPERSGAPYAWLGAGAAVVAVILGLVLLARRRRRAGRT